MGVYSGQRLYRVTYAILIFAILASAISQLPGSAGLEEYVTGDAYIIAPFHSLPAVVSPGDHFGAKIRVKEPLDVSRAYLQGLNVTVELGLESVSGLMNYTVDEGEGLVYSVQEVNLTLPEDAPDGLYTLVIETSIGRLVSPRSVLVDSSGGPRGHIRIAQLSDIHIGASDEGIPNDLKNTRYIALLNTFYFNFGLDLAVATGDNIDIGTSRVSDIILYNHVNQLLLPMLIVPGNHDWAQVSGINAFMKAFYGRFLNTHRYWYWVYGDFLIIGLDTKWDGAPNEYQLSFLERVLSAHSNKTAIILMHHPLFYRSGFYSGTPEDLRDALYRSWEQKFDIAKRFLEIIEEHKNVVAVLAGHVHRDADAVYRRSDGSLVYFMTTTTANHGHPDEAYWGFKVIDVYTNGTVSVFLPSGRPYLRESGSINTENFMVFQYVDEEFKAVTWTINTTGFEEFTPDNVTLVFYLNKTLPLSSYQFYGDVEKIHSTRYYDTGEFHLVIAFVNATTPGKITLAAYEDSKEPEAKIASIQPAKPRAGRAVTVFIKASDEGWGLDKVALRVTTPSQEEVVIEAIQLPLSNQYIAVFKASEPGEYSIVAEAVDLAGNVGFSETVNVRVAGERKAETTTTPATTTMEETKTPEETTEAPQETTPTGIMTESPRETVTTVTEETEATTPERETTKAEETAAPTTKPATETAKTTETVTGEGVPAWAVASILLITLAVLGLAFIARTRRPS